MPTSKSAATKKVAAKKAAANKTTPVAKKDPAKKASQPVTGVIFRTKIDLAGILAGAKTVKQLARAVAKLTQTLVKMDESGAVRLEQPVTAKGAHLATTDAKAAKRFGMEEGRAPRGAKTAAPAAKKVSGSVKAAETLAPAPAKKAAAKKAPAKKTRAQAAPADAAPVSEAADTAVPAVKKHAAKKAAVKKVSAKKAARKTGPANGVNAPGRAAAPDAASATDTPGADAAAS